MNEIESNPRAVICAPERDAVNAVYATSAPQVRVTRPLPFAVPSSNSHHAHAQRTLLDLTKNGWPPVYHQGELYVLDDDSIWRQFDREHLIRRVAELNDGRKNCTKRTDYVGIADQAIAIAADSEFFGNAPVGVACTDTFYRVCNGQLLEEPLGPDHRQRVKLDFEPQTVPTPLFEEFLHKTFSSSKDGEEEQQTRLLQEIAGAVMLGVMQRFQKAILFYDPYGRAGKGTSERILRELVPKEFTSAVSPFKWDKEYYLADLIGSRLNVVGELPDGECIPSANFKSVMGGDLLAGRHPSRPVVTFQNDAAHLFTSNYFVTTKDHSTAFYSRWLLLEFPNSLLVSGGEIDPGLADRIITNEISGIARWALEGGIRLLQQGGFSDSTVHDRLMTQWRRTASSIHEFIHECCVLGPDLLVRRSDFYGAYASWCKESRRSAFSKSKLKLHIEHSIDLPVRFTVLDGNEVMRDIKVSEEFINRFTSLG